MNLYLLLVSTLFLGCSEKKQTVSAPLPKRPAQIEPVNRTQTVESSHPSLGEPISLPSSPTINEPTEEPKRRRVEFRRGKSYLQKRFKLPSKLKESSGLLKIDNRLWSFNDSGGEAALYAIDERSGKITKTVRIINAKNRDWEDIAYDENYVYIGDFGNNRGNSRDLKIYKIPRAALRSQKRVRAEVIRFRYSDQKDFRLRPYKHNYDCEAMVAYHGKLYLFSKDWEDQKSRLYELSSSAGSHVAQYISSFNTQGMVTGASINKELDLLLLTTYSPLLSVDIWAFKNFDGENFFSGDAKKLTLSTSLGGQVEGVTFVDNYRAYLSSEAFHKYFVSFDAALYSLDFSREFE